MNPPSPQDTPARPPAALDPAAQADRSELLLLASNEGHWDWDVPTGAVWYSPRCHELLGYADGELEPTVAAIRALLHPADVARIGAVEERVFTENVGGAQPGGAPSIATLAAELRLRHRDGSYRWLLTRFAVRRDPAGRPLRIAGSYLDITARKDAEARGDRFQEHLMQAQAVAHIGAGASPWPPSASSGRRRPSASSATRPRPRLPASPTSWPSSIRRTAMRCASDTTPRSSMPSPT